MKMARFSCGKLKEKYWKQAIAEYEKHPAIHQDRHHRSSRRKSRKYEQQKEIEQVKRKEKNPNNTSQNQTTINSHYIEIQGKMLSSQRSPIEPTHDPRAKRLCIRHWRIKRPAQGRLTTQ